MDAFGRKAAKTLNWRAGSFLTLIRWLKSVGQEPFPLTHAKCHAYVRTCRVGGAPATRAFEARKAWRVATYLLGLDNSMEIFKSPQIDGAIHASYQTKRLTKRSTPMSKQAMMALERAAVHSTAKHETSIASFLRFCVGSRSRGGDATRIGQEPALDVIPETGIGYVDCPAHITTRSRVQTETSRMGVEISAHSWGLCEAN